MKSLFFIAGGVGMMRLKLPPQAALARFGAPLAARRLRLKQRKIEAAT
jgi:hypothetical protein